MIRKIPLTQGKYAIVDEEDYIRLTNYKWVLVKLGLNAKNYACSRINKKMILMHRLIMGLSYKDGKMIDHKNQNGLDNRRSNLRLCTKGQNAANSKFHSNTTSSYKGVSWNKKMNKWEAYIKVNYKKIHLGCYENEIIAALAYDRASQKYFGQYSHCNYLKSK